MYEKDTYRFRYDGKVLPLTTATEEAATYYAVMLEHDYVTREVSSSLLVRKVFHLAPV